MANTGPGRDNVVAASVGFRLTLDDDHVAGRSLLRFHSPGRRGHGERSVAPFDRFGPLAA